MEISHATSTPSVDCRRYDQIDSILRKDWVHCVEFVDDSRLLVGSEEGVELVEVRDRALRETGKRLDVPATCASFNNNTVAIGTADFKVWIYDYELRKIGRLLHGDFLNGVALTADGTRLFAGGRDNLVSQWPREYWQAQDGQRIAESFEPAVAVSDRGRIATYHDIGPDGETAAFVRILGEAQGNSDTVSVAVGESFVASLAFARDELWLAGITTDGEVIVWDCDSGDQLQSWMAHDWGSLRESNVETRGHLAVSPDGKFLASCGDNPDYAMWDMSNVQAKKSPRRVDVIDEEGWFSFVAFSPRNQLALCGGLPTRLGISKAGIFSAGRFEHAEVRHHEEWVRQVAFSPTKNLLAVQHFANIVIRWLHQRPLFSANLRRGA